MCVGRVRCSWPLNRNCSRCPAWTPASQAGSSGRSQRWRMRNTWRGRTRRNCSRESGSFSKGRCRNHCCSDCSVSWHWWGYCRWTNRKDQRLMTWPKKRAEGHSTSPKKNSSYYIAGTDTAVIPKHCFASLISREALCLTSTTSPSILSRSLELHSLLASLLPGHSHGGARFHRFLSFIYCVAAQLC